MTPEAFLEKVKAADGLRVRVEKTQQGSDAYQGDDEQHRPHTVTTHVIEAFDGRILGGIDDDASADTVKTLVRVVRDATGIELD